MTHQEDPMTTPRTADDDGPFMLCPVCAKSEQVTMRPDWQALVEGGDAMPIVGCGNPWHYVDLVP